jgi:uncharacterized coiled-coil DUF342 family protein
MEQKNNKVNYKSDFDFTANFKAFGQGGEVEIGFANYDWEIVLTTGCSHLASKGYVVSYKGGVCTNCFNDNGKVHIVMNDHKLGVGQLQGVVKANIPNPIYPDGHQLLMHNMVLPFELVTDNGDAPSEVEVEILLPYLYDSAYRIAVASGYKGTQEEYYQLASQLPNAVETAMQIKDTATSLENSAETIGGAIETLGATTEAIEQGANVIKDNADTLQASANIVKTSAEQIGANIADLQESVSSIDGAVEDINKGASTIANSATKVETSATTLEGVSATISGSVSSLRASATAIAEGANTIKSSADTLQTNADKVSESATKVEQAVEPLVQASESLDATKQAFEMLSSEWADGRQAIATALTNRRYPTEPTESFHAMAEKVENMSYEEGWFAKIGYTDDNASALKEMIDYSYELAKGWDSDGSTPSLFEGNNNILFYPIVDTSQIPTAERMFYGTSSLLFVPNLSLPKAISTDTMFTNSNVRKVGDIDIPNATRTQGMFSSAIKVTHIGAINSPMATSMSYTFNVKNIVYVKSVDVGSATQMATFISTGILFICMKNIGKSTLITYDFSAATSWGTGGEENRQSLIDSLITYSYDRASNGMSTATIKLSANTKALLTDDEIAQITAKGFTIS